MTCSGWVMSINGDGTANRVSHPSQSPHYGPESSQKHPPSVSDYSLSVLKEIDRVLMMLKHHHRFDLLAELRRDQISRAPSCSPHRRQAYQV